MAAEPDPADLELELTTLPDDPTVFWVALRFRLSGSDVESDLLNGRAPAARFDMEALLERQANAANYGAALGEMLLADADLLAAWGKAKSAAHSHNQRLRLRLLLGVGAEALHTLRWETLRIPGENGFLAQSETLLFSRYLPSPDHHPVTATPVSQVQALVVVASPTGLGAQLAPVDVEGELRRARSALGDIPLHTLAPGEHATLNAIGARLGQGVSLLYLACHGMMAHGAAYLALENEQGAIAWTAGAQLAQRLEQMSERPKLVVLAACQSAGTGAVTGNPALAAVGPLLATAGIPSVVAMQGNVFMQTVERMMPIFFSELRRHGVIDLALATARGRAQEQSDWWAPALYMRLRSGRLFVDEEIEAGRAVKVTPPPEPMPLPDVTKFVGRKQELAYFADLLTRNHVVVIAGLAGIGKTAMAVKLAQAVARTPDHIFWHQFHLDEGIDSVIWKLAGLLYRCGRKTLWEMLDGVKQSGGQPPPTEILLDYLIPLLRGQGYTLCLDDFHHAEDDPLVKKAVKKLQPLLLTGDVNLIVTSRRMPEIVQDNFFTQLTGLNAQETGDFIAASGITLANDLLTELHDRTEGNPELLALAVYALKRQRRAGQVVKRLALAADIESFLLREVDKSLADDKKLVMTGVAVLLNYPGTRSAIETTLSSSSVKLALRYLANRFLLREQEGVYGEEYLTHAILQEFYYDLLGTQDRQEMHRRAGAFYERDEPNALRAAMHYQRAGETARAVELATTNVWGIVNQGQAFQLRMLFETVAQSPLDPEPQLRVLVSLGDLLDFLGEGKLAQEYYQMALTAVSQVQAAAARDAWEARACLGMGSILEHQAPQEALGWLERGVAVIGGENAEIDAALRNRIGSVHIGLAEYDTAITFLLQSLALLPESVSKLRIKVLLNLNTAYAMSGQAAQASQSANRALAMSRQLHDVYEMLAILSNIAIDKEVSGDWAGAGADYEEALTLAQQLGSSSEQARIHNLLGTLRLHQRDDVAAETHLLAATEAFRKMDNLEYLAATLPVLAQLHIRRAAWEPAGAALAEAEHLATESGWDYILPETYTTQAQLALLTDDPAGAQERAEQAIDIAARLEEVIEEGKAWRAKGQALAAGGQFEAALTAFERSAELLSGQDPYELAQTQRLLAHVIALHGDVAASSRLLEEANATLRQLGVRDLM